MCCHGSRHTHGYLESLLHVSIIPSFISDIPACCVPQNTVILLVISNTILRITLFMEWGFFLGEVFLKISNPKDLLFPNSWQKNIPTKWEPWTPKSGNQGSRSPCLCECSSAEPLELPRLWNPPSPPAHLLKPCLKKIGVFLGLGIPTRSSGALPAGARTHTSREY